MDASKPIKIGVSSSLIDLKAELLRKKEQLSSSKSRDNRGGVVKTAKKSDLLSAKSKYAKANKGVEVRSQADRLRMAEEEKTIEKSKSVLEAKARLYDKMQRGALLLADEEEEEDEPSEASKLFAQSLVNFQQKAIDEIKEKRMKLDVEEPQFNQEIAYEVDEDEWTEFTDALGRTRRCLKKDLPSFIERDEMSRPENPGICLSASADDRLREMKREKWELEAEILAAKDKVHYQDVLYDELRTHGAGYYAFAKDEATRAQQMKDLKKLSEETKATRAKIKKDKKDKKSTMKARLLKIKNKKRAKAGLPPLPEEEDTDSDEEKEEEKDNDKTESEEFKPETRAWDFGKKGVYGPKPSTFDELDEKWLRDRRSDRNPEFAPPSSVYSAGGLRKQYNSTLKDPTTSSASTSKYSNFVKSSDTAASSTSTRGPIVIEPPPKPFLPPQTFWKQRKEAESRAPPQKPIPIQDEMPAPIPLSSEEFDRGRGTEIAPPPTFEYYHGNHKPKPTRQQGTDPAEMMDAVSAGLKALRQQFEKNTKGEEKDFSHFPSF